MYAISPSLFVFPSRFLYILIVRRGRNSGLTRKNKRLNILEELARGEESMKAFTVLAYEGLLRDAISRLYYSLSHFARGLLFSLGLEPRTHEGVAALFNLHFVKKGTFTTRDLHLLSRMMKFREEADYSFSYAFIEQDCKDLAKEVDAVCKKIKAHLKAGRHI